MILNSITVVFVAGLVAGCYSCGGTYSQTHGSLRSPITGTKIGEVTVCDYVLLAPNGQRIKVVFIDLVLKTTCCSCTNDYIELRDGESDNSTLIGRYCAHNIPKIVYSTENKLWIRFRTDYKTSSENRFKLTFDTPCGRHYSALKGDFSSVGFPEPYSPNMECLYTIAVPRGRLKVSFESFDVEARSANCEFDFLEVKEILYVEYNNNIFVSRTRRYCGSVTPPTIYSTIGSYLWFRFKTDSNGQRSGFRAKYRTVSVGEGSCNKKLTTQKGLIYSKNYPFPFPQKTECYWEIEVKTGKFVFLTFDTFNFSRSSDKCKYGYLQVYDGLGFESLIGQYCGPRLPRSIVSRKNTMSLRLVSSSIAHTGWFSAQYSTSNQGPCGAKKFACQNHECIVKSKHCDGLKHCRDGSDEVGCPPKDDTPTWYSFWPVTVVIVMLFMGIWLWRTWKKFMTPRSDLQVSYCASPCHHHSNGGVSEVMEPPSYHEAISQPVVHNNPPPSYEEAINSQPPSFTETIINEERPQEGSLSVHNNVLAENNTTAVNGTVSNDASTSPPSTRNSQSVDELGQPYTSHRPLDRTSEV